VFLTLLGGSCGTLRLPPLPAQSVAEQPQAMQQDGLALAARVAEPAECARYLGTDPRRKGVLPVLLTVENRSGDASFLLDPTEWTLAGAEGTFPRSQRRLIEGPPSSAGAWVGAILLPFALLPGFIVLMVAHKSNTDTDVIDFTYATSSFATTTLSPGETARGFVFLEVGKKPVPSAARLVVHATCLPAHRQLRLDVPVSMGAAARRER